MTLEIQICIAFVLDQLLGDPRCLPHPIQAIGYLAARVEVVCRRVWQNQRLAGISTVVVVLFTVGLIVFSLMWLAAFVSGLKEVVGIYFLFTAIAARDLARHSSRVYFALHDADIERARQEVAMIVGRETSALDAAGVTRACVESVAENLVDGVTAPLFWAVIGGPLGAMLYKSINTMDSMFGYKNDKYLQFGWAAARLDDLVNYIPARLTAFLIMMAAALLRLSMRNSYLIWHRDRYQHASPNSGQSEAAAAGALGIQLGGPSIYFGKRLEKPTIGDSSQVITANHIVQANRLMLVSSVLALILFITLRIVLLISQ